MALAGTQGRGGVNAPRPRTIVRNVYRGVFFYSSDGGTLGPQQQASIVAAAQKIPTKVWDKLAMVGTRVFVMKNKDNVMAPVLLEYLRALGVPKADAIYSFKGEKDMAFTDAGRHPVAVIGIGSLPPFPNGQPRPRGGVEQNQVGHILIHETAHTVDFSFQFMKTLGAIYATTERKTRRTTDLASDVIDKYINQPLSTTAPGRMDMSARKDFRSTIPKNYTAGYGESTIRYDKTVRYPRAEVFAEALARYWNKEMIPPKMQTFFDTHPDLSRGGSRATTPVTPFDLKGQRPPK